MTRRFTAGRARGRAGPPGRSGPAWPAARPRRAGARRPGQGEPPHVRVRVLDQAVDQRAGRAAEVPHDQVRPTSCTSTRFESSRPNKPSAPSGSRPIAFREQVEGQARVSAQSLSTSTNSSDGSSRNCGAERPHQGVGRRPDGGELVLGQRREPLQPEVGDRLRPAASRSPATAWRGGEPPAIIATSSSTLSSGPELVGQRLAGDAGETSCVPGLGSARGAGEQPAPPGLAAAPGRSPRLDAASRRPGRRSRRRGTSGRRRPTPGPRPQGRRQAQPALAELAGLRPLVRQRAGRAAPGPGASGRTGAPARPGRAATVGSYGARAAAGPRRGSRPRAPPMRARDGPRRRTVGLEQPGRARARAGKPRVGRPTGAGTPPRGPGGGTVDVGVAEAEGQPAIVEDEPIARRPRGSGAAGSSRRTRRAGPPAPRRRRACSRPAPRRRRARRARAGGPPGCGGIASRADGRSPASCGGRSASCARPRRSPT